MLAGSTNNQACRAHAFKTVARGAAPMAGDRRSCRRCLAQLGIGLSWTSQLGAGLHIRTARSSETARCRLRSTSAPPQLAGSSRRPGALANLEVWRVWRFGVDLEIYQFGDWLIGKSSNRQIPKSQIPKSPNFQIAKSRDRQIAKSTPNLQIVKSPNSRSFQIRCLVTAHATMPMPFFRAPILCWRPP
jgi:hypothetical protein